MTSQNPTIPKSSWYGVYKFMQLVKSAVLDSAGFAGVFLGLVFWLADEPLKLMSENFTYLFIGSAIIAISTAALKRSVNPELTGGWSLLDFLLQLVAVIFLWWIVIDGVLQKSENDTQQDTVSTGIETQQKNLKAHELDSRQKLEALEKQISTLSAQVEQLEESLNTSKTPQQ